MKFLAGFILGLVLVPIGIYCYLALGLAPVATSAPPLPLERKIVGMALKARLGKEANDKSPLPSDEKNFMAGAVIYRKQCAICHGLPDQPRPLIAAGMSPQPPELFRGKGVTDDSVGETHWKIRNGIRLSGMAAFKGGLNETEMWQVSLLLANAQALLPAVKQALSSPLKQTEPGASPAP